MKKKNSTEDKSETKQVNVNRYLTGYGQEYGGLSTHITNDSPDTIHFTFFQQVPWFIRLYLHTLDVQYNTPSTSIKNNVEDFAEWNLVPGEDHSYPGIMELKGSIEGRSSMTISVQFEKAFLHFTEYPPDAHRGFDIPSAFILVHGNSSEKRSVEFGWSNLVEKIQDSSARKGSYKFFTDGLLINLGTPDFSMPYNVITLTGTLFALIFGSLFTTLVRRMRNVKQQETFVSNRPIFRLISKVISFFDRFIK